MNTNWRQISFINLYINNTAVELIYCNRVDFQFRTGKNNSFCNTDWLNAICVNRILNLTELPCT